MIHNSQAKNSLNFLLLSDIHDNTSSIDLILKKVGSKKYDYIFGDYAYDKVRLKGYYDSKNKKKNKINDYSTIDDYIKKNE